MGCFPVAHNTNKGLNFRMAFLPLDSLLIMFLLSLLENRPVFGEEPFRPLESDARGLDRAAEEYPLVKR